MSQRQTIGEVIAYILSTIATVLLLPVVAPVVMWKNAWGYADKYAYLPGIQAGGGAVSGLSALVYVALIASLAGGGVVAATGDLSAGTLEASAEPATPTPEPTPTAQPTLPPADGNTTETETEQATETTAPQGPNEEDDQSDNYDPFVREYVTLLERADVDVVGTAMDRDSLQLTYEMKDPQDSKTTGRENTNVTLAYRIVVKQYTDGATKTPTDRKIPRHVSVTGVRPDGEVHQEGHIAYSWAIEQLEGELTLDEYVELYYDSIETRDG